MILGHFQVVGSFEGAWGSFLFCLGLHLGREDDAVLNQAVFDEWSSSSWPITLMAESQHSILFMNPRLEVRLMS